MSTVYRPKSLKTKEHLSAISKILTHVNSVAAKTSEDDFSQMNPEQKLNIYFYQLAPDINTHAHTRILLASI